ncbi:hypothetical protein N656DRAFT_699712 [Canariomyces notabilis]|uniref:Uncharacterized protein n=1 Tax=Canariomyces notabilis TaxID=2074819 RepID=A0AAN6YXJ1_9PEZI|nr:hypothetical protein N656DRAFT_699712 [Canariomyces arenarius]
MCDYTQREHACEHIRWIAARWCRQYTITHKRCPPNITHFEYRHELCGDCKARLNQKPVAWEHLITRPNARPGLSH